MTEGTLTVNPTAFCSSPQATLEKQLAFPYGTHFCVLKKPAACSVDERAE